MTFSQSVVGNKEFQEEKDWLYWVSRSLPSLDFTWMQMPTDDAELHQCGAEPTGPRSLLVAPANRDGAPPNVQYVHFSILRSLQKCRFRRGPAGRAHTPRRDEARNREGGGARRGLEPKGHGGTQRWTPQ